MPPPDLIAPDRLEELLGGALPEAEREARLQGLVRELRADAPVAPASLRVRVRALEDQPARRRVVLSRRRTALAFAVVLIAVAGVGAGIALTGDDSRTAVQHLPAPDQPDEGPAVDEEAAAPKPAPLVTDMRTLGKERTLSSGEALDAPPFPPRGRATDVELWMEVRLPDADELSGAAGEAMAVTRELGGWVAGSDIDTQGREGTAELALRVPVGRVEDAVVRLSELGTVTGQRVETVDLQAGIERRASRVEKLERAIRLLELRLGSGTLTPEEELRVRFRIERHENAIADLRRANLADRREAATSELALVLHTREGAAAEKKDEGGVAGAARDALEFLGAAGAIALFLVIVLSPVVLLLVLLWLAFRARLRRQETRLLERPGPASPPTA
ncbi:MAG: DUF4349 domain-containing protein [Gaiellaceae bacterium]